MKIRRALKIIIVSMLLMFISLIFAMQVNAEDLEYKYEKGKIWKYSYTDGSTQVGLETGSTVYLLHNNSAYIDNDKVKKCFSALHQPNIYCLEHGKKLSGYFDVGEEKTVKDPMLEYILYNGPDMNSLEGNYKTEASQNALWHYISSGYTDNGQLTGMTSNDWENADTGFWDAAMAHGNTVNTSLSPSISCEYNADATQINVTVSGSFENFDLYVNGSKYDTYTKGISDTANISIDAESYDGNVTVKVEAKKTITEYTVKYRILTNGSQQRLLVITDKYDDTVEKKAEASTTVYVAKDTNVSLQKYITHVNNKEVASRANRKAISTTTNAISSTILNSSGTNKYDDVITIAAGDYVTYKIEVYNNGETLAKQIVVTDNLPTGVTEYSINGGAYNNGASFTYTINNLAAGGSTSFYVIAYFGEYGSGILENKALISSTTPKNKTEFRTEDSDYVQMEKYSVSLEKYVTEIISKNIGSTTTNSDIRAYRDIIDYLIINTDETIDSLINKWNGKNISFDKKYDLNGDNKIDDKDLAIFENSKNITSFSKENIEKYMQSDLNGDGQVDSTDLNIYKIIKADLNEDKSLDNYDRYMFILKAIYQNNIESNEVLNYLYVQRLISQTAQDKDVIIEIINNYMKSDMNDDGYIDKEDNYIINDAVISIKDEESYAIKITENIAADELNINELQSYIDKYDINEDGLINNVEIEFFNEYKNRDQQGNKYNNISQKDYKTIIGLEEELKELLTIDLTNEEENEEENDNIHYDFNGDLKVYFDDYVVAEEMNLESSCEGINSILLINKDSEKFDTKFDFDDDEDVDYTDYEILTKYTNFLKFYHNYIQDQDRINNLETGLINKITIDQSDGRYNTAYDVNEDGKINFEDYIQARNTKQNEELINAINELLTISINSGNYDANFDFNNDSKVDYEDYKFLTEYYIEDIESIDTDSIVLEIESIIDNYSIFDRDSENPDFSQEDINVIKVYKGLKKYEPTYNIDKFDYTIYDINEDGSLNQKDIEIISNTYEGISNVSEISEINDMDTFIAFFKDNYNTGILEGLKSDSTVNTYEKLNVIIDSMNESKDIDIKGILNNKKYTINVTYTDVDTQSKVPLKTLDINGDGKVTSEDITFFNEHASQLSNITSFDKSIITNNDINNDGQVDSDDTTFYSKLMSIKDNTNVKNAIMAEVEGENNVSNGQGADSSGKVTGRENHPTYDQKGYSKENNPVRVEVGDVVTYTIKLTNTSESKKPIKVTKITDTFDENANANITYIDGSAKGYGRVTVDTANTANGELSITISNAPQIPYGQSRYLTLQFKVEVPLDNTNKEQVLKNTAEVTQITNIKNIDVGDSDGTTNNKDSDWIKTKIYQVSLEKYISKVEGINGTDSYDRSGIPEHNKDDDAKTTDYSKYNNVVAVKKGDNVTYTIKVTNDSSETGVYISEIIDYLPDGVKYNGTSYTGGQYNTITDNSISYTGFADKFLEPKASESFTITVEVIESNMSINLMKNVAKINTMENKNREDVLDSTQNNNQDADYFQMKDIIISGNVWNDKALNKLQDNYNGLFDSSEEKGILDIKVSLYRVGSAGAVATKYTDSNGNYTFTSEDVKDKASNGIKASKESSTKNRWKSYHSYYVVFEYDGVTYTSTPDGTSYKDITNSNYKIDSNAKEDNNLDKNIGVKSREEFNKEFNPINNGSGISYTTKNESGYIPQSNHNAYDSNGKLLDKYKMQSSTNCINIGNLANVENIEDMLQNVDLGLRGRDIFDLELTSDVDTIKVIINNEQGVYKYANKVTLRKSDLTANSTTDEDMANKVLEASNTYVDRQNQNIRTSDLDMSKTGTNGESYSAKQGISNIEVTYKITVHNASRTPGTATVVTNYYDNRYELQEVKAGKNCGISKVEPGNNGTGYNSVVITTTGDKMLAQSETMEIYVVYTAKNDLLNSLKGLGEKESLPTYNMAEITEYKTGTASDQTKYTKGLIDKDSAPGSVSEEQVRTTENDTPTTEGNPTTLAYYFGGNDLSKLKYEDDTYATPTLYFVANDAKRMISGTVFEDYTELIGDGDIKVKTGDGVQDKEYNFEPGIEGATVELLEIVEGEEEPVLRYTKTTGDNGEYTFSGFLPGNYIIKYHYGDTDKTFLLDNSPNTKSYNGEDFQSTNNTGSHNSNELKYNELEDDQKVLWYAYNKSAGISTATDITERREKVSTSVTKFSDDQMTVLNNARDGMSKDAAKVKDITVDSIIEATYMYAQTNPMLLTVEETVLEKTSDNKIITIEKDSFPEGDEGSYSTYNVSNMNFGIAEVPVTTIDLQKHVYSFTIKDSTGKNTLAAIKKDLNNTAVTVNPSKIAPNRIETVIKVLDEVLVEKEGEYTANDIRNKIGYNTDITKNINQNITIKTGLTADEINELETAITKYSLAREIKIVKAWKVTEGNVLAAPGTSVIDVSIEDDKLQGAKLEVTYEMSANIYAEKNFNSEPLTIPSIKGIVDYIDNNLSYNEVSKVINESSNNTFWSLAKQSEITFGEGEYGNRFGTLDPEGTKYSTILTAKTGNALLREECGKGVAYITLEKVLSSTDMTIQDIITSNVDIYEYKNSIEITALEYKNQEGEGGFIFRDRVRTADRYIILAGRQHDSATSEIITIHPPTGDSSVSMIYLIIGVVALAVVSAGILGIKKFVLKK